MHKHQARPYFCCPKVFYLQKSGTKPGTLANWNRISTVATIFHHSDFWRVTPVMYTDSRPYNCCPSTVKAGSLTVKWAKWANGSVIRRLQESSRRMVTKAAKKAAWESMRGAAEVKTPQLESGWGRSPTWNKSGFICAPSSVHYLN